MNIHSIVANLYTDRRVVELMSKQEPADLRDDLLHHCVLEIYRIHEAYPGKIEKLHEDNQLFAWFVGMVRNQNWSDKSTFWNRFKKGHEPEEIYLCNADLMKVEETTPQQQEDEQAAERWGGNFIDYFYNNFHKRGKKEKQPSLQMALSF